MSKTISRLVLNFPGFETTTSVHQIERLIAGGHKTGELWSFDLTPGEISDETEKHKTTTTFLSKGEGWQTETRYVHFSWADIIAKYESVPYPKNLYRHFPGYLAFFTDGTVWKYAKASMRYWGFTIYPLLLMALFAIFAWFASGFVLSYIWPSWIVQLILSILVFLLF
ncbi:MAG: hypothetical protein AAF412_00315, partial [Pseudomonadota bacterium]